MAHRQDNRPTYKELNNKLKVAIKCLNEPDRPHVFIDKKVTKLQIRANIAKLNLDSEKEYWKLVTRCLTKASQDVGACYRGSYPPQKCEKVSALKNKEMWAFTVYDDILKKYIYTKFCIKEVPQGILFYAHITCHEDDPK